MVDVVSQRCNACPLRAYYAAPGQKARRCPDHKADGDIRNPTRRCKTQICKEPALYGKTAPARCKAHRLCDDANFVEHPCKKCGLLWRLSEASLCSYCIDGPLVRLAKQREVKDFLSANLPRFPPTCYDRTTPALQALGGRERPDFYWDCGAYAAILEVDENQHSDRREVCDDCIRMVNIAQAERRPTFFLRYNPDAYVPADGRQHAKRKRLDLLARCLRELLTEPPPVGPLAYKRLFFDGFSETDAGVWVVVPQT
jgi:hypothetical protein